MWKESFLHVVSAGEFCRAGLQLRWRMGRFLRNSGCRNVTLSRADLLSYSVPTDCVLRMSVGQWVQDGCQTLHLVWQRQRECILCACAVRLRSCARSHRVCCASHQPLSSSFHISRFHRRTRQLPPFKLPCLGLLFISCLSLCTPTH